MKKLFLSLVVVALLFSSCEKKITGCTDSIATNYNPNANESSNTCNYSGSIVFYTNQQTAVNLINAGVTQLNFFVAGELVGQISPQYYFNVVPSCGQTGTITAFYNLGLNKNATAALVVTNQNGATLYNANLIFTAGTCKPLQLL